MNPIQPREGLEQDDERRRRLPRKRSKRLRLESIIEKVGIQYTVMMMDVMWLLMQRRGLAGWLVGCCLVRDSVWF